MHQGPDATVSQGQGWHVGCGKGFNISHHWRPILEEPQEAKAYGAACKEWVVQTALCSRTRSSGHSEPEALELVNLWIGPMQAVGRNSNPGRSIPGSLLPLEFTYYRILPCIMRSCVLCAHIWPKLSGEKIFHFNFQFNFLFIYKTNDCIPGYYFVYWFRCCLLELHF